MSGASKPHPPGSSFPDAVILDLDGTMWDATWAVAEAWAPLVAEAAREFPTLPPVTQPAIMGVMGMAHQQIGETLFGAVPPARRETLLRACYEAEARHITRTPPPLYPGVAAALRTMQPILPLFIVSNCQRGYIEAFLAGTGLGGVFRDIECHGDTGLSKAANLGLLARRNGLARPWYVGDTQGDMDAAHGAGFAFVHAAYGFGRVSGPAPAIHGLEELPPMLAQARQVAGTVQGDL